MSQSWMIHLIDDDEPVRTSLVLLMEALGFRVASYVDAEDFLKRDGWEPGILVSDVRMPGIGGIKLTKLLKDRGSGMPTILVTGHDSPELRAEAMLAGAETVLEKPVDVRTLLAAITRVAAKLRSAGEAS